MQNVVVAVDFSDMTEPTVAVGSDLAKLAAGTLWLLSVAPPAAEFVGRQLGRRVVEDPPPDDLRENFEALTALQRRFESEAIRVKSRMVRGAAAECILDEANRIGADVIVLGSHGHGALYRSLVGSVSEGVLRGAKCPVLIVPARRAG